MVAVACFLPGRADDLSAPLHNLHKNLQLLLIWKLTAISPQENTFQKPWNQASVFDCNYYYKYG